MGALIRMQIRYLPRSCRERDSVHGAASLGAKNCQVWQRPALAFSWTVSSCSPGWPVTSVTVNSRMELERNGVCMLSSVGRWVRKALVRAGTFRLTSSPTANSTHGSKKLFFESEGGDSTGSIRLGVASSHPAPNADWQRVAPRSAERKPATSLQPPRLTCGSRFNV